MQVIQSEPPWEFSATTAVESRGKGRHALLVLAEDDAERLIVPARASSVGVRSRAQSYRRGSRAAKKDP